MLACALQFHFHFFLTFVRLSLPFALSGMSLDLATTSSAFDSSFVFSEPKQVPDFATLELAAFAHSALTASFASIKIPHIHHDSYDDSFISRRARFLGSSSESSSSGSSQSPASGSSASASGSSQSVASCSSAGKQVAGKQVAGKKPRQPKPRRVRGTKFALTLAVLETTDFRREDFAYCVAEAVERRDSGIMMDVASVECVGEIVWRVCVDSKRVKALLTTIKECLEPSLSVKKDVVSSGCVWPSSVGTPKVVGWSLRGKRNWLV